MSTIKPVVNQYEISDGVNPLITISIDHDADPGVLSFVLDQQEGGDYLYVTLDGLKALVEAATEFSRGR
jgi:hypothetical protein